MQPDVLKHLHRLVAEMHLGIDLFDDCSVPLRFQIEQYMPLRKFPRAVLNDDNLRFRQIVWGTLITKATDPSFSSTNDPTGYSPIAWRKSFQTSESCSGPAKASR